MAIVETKVWTRANTATTFFKDANPNGIVTTIRSAEIYQTLINNGNYSVVTTYPDTTGNLQMQEVSTYQDFATFSSIDTNRGINLDAEFIAYHNEHELEFPPVPGYANVSYSLTGYDDPFHVTTTYNFPTENDPYIAVMTRSLEIAYDHKGKLADTIVGNTSITVVHQYTNAGDYTDNLFNDLLAYVPQLATKNATRTITYTAGTYTK